MADDRGYVIIALVGTLLPFVAGIVALRFYTRSSLVKSIGPDDWSILVALLFTVATGVDQAVMTRVGLGQHASTISPASLEKYTFTFYLSIVFYYCSLGSIKLALLLQYKSLVSVRSKTLILVVTILISAWSLSLIIVSVFNCSPVSGFWRHDIPSTCIPTLPLWYVNAAGNILTDLIIFSLPIPFVWKLDMPCSQRLSLLGVFCLGFFTCVISVVRIEFLNLGNDPTYNNIAPAGWSFGELCAGVVTACLPTLRPLLLRVVIPKLASTTALLSRKTPLRSRSSSQSASGACVDDSGVALAEDACEMATTGKDEEEGCSTPVTQKQEFRNAM
ncbi:hypothetical protein INS49_009172 [Diaporthe citri]|uniref:uncharacterized protein n=1 Tax=Diaporthe citri TaxID=83186 RepID=UPI001C81F3FF|nr:uncharacterized protein INS49_009172 [Diaporthe citri]KAG6364069.1 hypothetical protein INS49_009172 [Diaporthe citri]